jgi:hypothetical protein
MPAWCPARAGASHQTTGRTRPSAWLAAGGARARDDLADVPRLWHVSAAADPGPKLQIKAHADAIQQLRNRWKELDRLGAVAASRCGSALTPPCTSPMNRGRADGRAQGRAPENLAEQQALPTPWRPCPKGRRKGRWKGAKAHRLRPRARLCTTSGKSRCVRWTASRPPGASSARPSTPCPRPRAMR